MHSAKAELIFNRIKYLITLTSFSKNVKKMQNNKKALNKINKDKTMHQKE